MSRLLPRILHHIQTRLALPRLQHSPLFDARWYRDSYRDLAGSKMRPELHYLRYGAAEGRDPGPLFSTSGWRLQHPQTQENPLLAQMRGLQGQNLPSFAGARPAAPDAPVVVFVGHQALEHNFGAERSLLHMLERAHEAGLAVELVLPHCLSRSYFEMALARVRRLHLLPFAWRHKNRQHHGATLAAMVQILRQSGAREMHQNTLVLDMPLQAAKLAGLPAVVHLRELPAQDPELCARMGLSAEEIRLALLRDADRFIANSPAMAQWLDPEAALPAERVVIVPNRIDPELTELPFAPQRPLRVALIGSNIAKKGIYDLCEIAKIYNNLTKNQTDAPQVRFLLIGPDTPDLAALKPLPEGVEHPGYAPSPAAALAQADIVLSVSHFAESFGRSVLEAMAAGRPVICYDRGVPPQLLGASDGSALEGRPPASAAPGVVVPADNPGAAAQALYRLLRQKGTLEQMSQAGRKRAEEWQKEASAIPPHQLFLAACPRPEKPQILD